MFDGLNAAELVEQLQQCRAQRSGALVAQLTEQASLQGFTKSARGQYRRVPPLRKTYQAHARVLPWSPLEIAGSDELSDGLGCRLLGDAEQPGQLSHAMGAAQQMLDQVTVGRPQVAEARPLHPREHVEVGEVAHEVRQVRDGKRGRFDGLRVGAGGHLHNLHCTTTVVQ